MKSIHTLIPDIQDILKRKDGWFTDELASNLSADVSRTLQAQLGEAKGPPTLRLSQMGPRCPKALWNSIYHPELAEPLPPWAEFKYSFGHIIEALAITLSKASGHDVKGEQDELKVDGIIGHRDCVIDGCVVDVKSASSRSFDKIKAGLLATDDSFGYLDQLDGYLLGSADDPLVTTKDRGYILAIHKELGHMTLYEHILRKQSIRNRISRAREIVSRPVPPACECGTVAHGESGNIRLGVQASYNSYKWECFPQLRAFLYSDGPMYFSKVVKHPTRRDGTKLTEIDKRGNILYN